MEEKENQNQSNEEVGSTEGPKKAKIIKEEIFVKYLKEAKKETIQYSNYDSNIKFELLQKRKINIFKNAFILSYFYDQNFTGNKDFMHIPSITQVIQNIVNYPIIIAKKRDEFGKEEIVGATTIKFENNKKYSNNPYFPTKNENVLSITGILSKQNIYGIYGNPIRGIGKHLFKTAIKGAYEIHKNNKIRLICEIDCRNNNSMNSLRNAIKELQEENFNISANLVGYYEILKHEHELTEAPTFLFEICFGENEASKCKTIFSYNDVKTSNLFYNILQVIKRKTDEERKYINKVNENIVKYHEIKPIDILNMNVIPGLTAIGNDRIPVTTKVVEYMDTQKQSL